MTKHGIVGFFYYFCRMSMQGKIHRLFIIVDKVLEYQNRGYYLSKTEIHKILEAYDLNTSDRTFARDIETLNYEFDIYIKFDAKEKGYFIDLDESIKIQDILSFFELVSMADIISKNLKDNKELLKSISFDARENLYGIDNLNLIFPAIKKNQLISFTHINYTHNRKTNYKIKPYLLKEFQNRWYIVGEIANNEEIRIFGIDRIENLNILTETFIPNPVYQIKEKFNDIIGLVYGGKVEIVELSFTTIQGRYVKSLPWHKSQKIIVDNDKEFRIELKVFPNDELKRKILALGSQVKVLKPNWLAKEIKKELKATLLRY